jgi:hypothetical protein
MKPEVGVDRQRSCACFRGGASFDRAHDEGNCLGCAGAVAGGVYARTVARFSAAIRGGEFVRDPGAAGGARDGSGLLGGGPGAGFGAAGTVLTCPGGQCQGVGASGTGAGDEYAVSGLAAHGVFNIKTPLSADVAFSLYRFGPELAEVMDVVRAGAG